MSNFIIYSDNELTEGLFGQVILCIFSILPKLEFSQLDVSTLKWMVRTDSYGDIFPSILEYNSSFLPMNNIQSTDHVKSLFQISITLPIFVLGDDFEKLHDLFFKYFKIPTELEQIAHSFNLTEYLGVHFRGTDKTTDNVMNDPVTKTDFLIILDSYIKVNNINKLFLSTDENEMYLLLKEKYPDMDIKTSRELTGNLLWRGNHDYNHGKEAMIDMLCLSKCNSVIKVSSALSAFTKVINPKLKIYRVNSYKMFMDIPYFPDAYIPLLEVNDKYEKECNILLRNIQKNDWSNDKSDKEYYQNFFYKTKK